LISNEDYSPSKEFGWRVSFARMIGKHLKAVRENKGLSQEVLAEKASVHRTYISLLERNKKSPTLDVLIRICRALEIKTSTFISKIENDTDKK